MWPVGEHDGWGPTPVTMVAFWLRHISRYGGGVDCCSVSLPWSLRVCSLALCCHCKYCAGVTAHSKRTNGPAELEQYDKDGRRYCRGDAVSTSSQQKLQKGFFDFIFDLFSEVSVLYNPLKNKGTISSDIPTLYLVKGSESDANNLAEEDDVLSVEPNCYVHPSRMPNDPEYSQQWGHHIIATETAWETITGNPKLQTLSPKP